MISIYLLDFSSHFINYFPTPLYTFVTTIHICSFIGLSRRRKLESSQCQRLATYDLGKYFDFPLARSMHGYSLGV